MMIETIRGFEQSLIDAFYANQPTAWLLLTALAAAAVALGLVLHKVYGR